MSPGDRCPFEACDGSGFVVDEASRRAAPCRCRPQRLAHAKAASLQARIPRRYQGVSFDREPVRSMSRHVLAPVRAYCRAIDEHLDAGRGLWFEGDTGTGKTTLAMLVSATALRTGRSVAIYSLPRLLGQLRSTYDEGADEPLLELVDRLCAVDLLHVDDVGAEQTSPWVLEQLYTIVNTRYEDERAVVITTNLNVEDLREQIGARTVSRLLEMCGDPVPMYGEDRRVVHDFPAPTPFAGTADTDPARYGELGFRGRRSGGATP